MISPSNKIADIVMPLIREDYRAELDCDIWVKKGFEYRTYSPKKNFYFPPNGFSSLTLYNALDLVAGKYSEEKILGWYEKWKLGLFKGKKLYKEVVQSAQKLEHEDRNCECKIPNPDGSIRIPRMGEGRFERCVNCAGRIWA